MVKKEFANEREGQIEFFENYRIPYKDNPVLIDNTDGVYHGNIFEFKLNINDTGKVLFQAIKYLSKMRIKGESVPARILLVDLNKTIVYVYNSIDYIDDIQKVYIGASSTNNEAFSGIIEPVAKYDYSDMIGSAEVQNLIINKVENETDWYIPIDIDENCIVGWAERYYKELPKATKGDFLGDDRGKVKIIGEIREPKHFKGLINPYMKPTNEKFKYLMDCLNDRLSKKDLGAFYTPAPYCEKASELVMKAVDRVPEGNDYIILDRCAGTGNLESALIGKYKNGSELISHCVVSTYEYYEYKVLAERIGDKVRNIIPPTEANVVYENGKVSNADAMSKEFIDNPLIKHYIDNPKCTIILFENPPYSEVAGGSEKERKNNTWKNSYIAKMAKEKLESKKTNDLANLFIWSAFNLGYLRQLTDSYIVFSPIKYWKSASIISKKSFGAFIFNRKNFHATESGICCMGWMNIDYDEQIEAEAYHIDDNKTIYDKTISLKKVYECYSKINDKRTFPTDETCPDVVGKDGYINNIANSRIKSIRNNNIIAYLMHCGFSFGNPALQTQITRIGYYGGNGYYLRNDNYLIRLPLFVAGWWDCENKYYYKDVIFRCLDGGDAYTQDEKFLKSCLIYTCLSNQNKCLSFTGSDGRYYRNELCFDNTHGNTVASADLLKMIFDEDEEDLITTWEKILEEAKTTANYNPNLTYGVYQITKELNTFKEVGSGRTKTKVYDYPNLNGNLNSLRIKLKEYYKSHITDKMFEYELLK